MMKRQIAFTTIGFTMLAATAMAQTTAPSATPAPSTSAPAPAATSTKAPDQNLAGQGKWRASKLMGVDIYGPDNTKVGDITEVVMDKTGKIEMVTIGVGGFLGLGSKDVAVPFDQITWSDQPMASTTPAPAPTSSTGGSGSMSGGTAAPAAMNAAPKEPMMYPDHGKITMTKDQLNTAPAVTYSSN